MRIFIGVFELKSVSEDPELVRLSDGVFTLAFLKESQEDSTGLHTSGFQVEDLESVQQKSEKGGQASPQSELQVADSDHNLIDLTTKDFGVVPDKTRYPIRHIALYTADPKRLSNFYNAAFGKKSRRRNVRQFLSRMVISILRCCISACAR